MADWKVCPTHWNAMIVVVVIAILMSFEAAGEEPRSFAKALALYQQGDFAQAAKDFERIANSPGPLAPVARFAFGNARVRQATTGAVDPSSANALLGEAIVVYRALLDQPESGGLKADDIRHNLELAKRLLDWKAPDHGDGPSRPPPDQKGTPKEDQGDAVPTNEPAEPSTKASTGQRSEMDEGEVLRPTPGVAFVDPGPLSAQQADEAIAETLRRIERDQANRREGQRATRPRMPGDY